MGKFAPVALGCLRHVFAEQPCARGNIRIDRQQHDAPARDAGHLGKPAVDVGPVMHGHDGHRRVGGAVGERQALSDSEHSRRKSRIPLQSHRRRRLDRDYRPVGRLVRARAGTDVHNGPGVSERFEHGGSATWVGPPVSRVAVPDRVVPDAACCHRGHQRPELRSGGELVLAADHELSGAQHDVHSRRVSGYPGDGARFPGAQLAKQHSGLAANARGQGGQAVQRSLWTTFLAVRRSASDRVQKVAVSRSGVVRGGRTARSADQTRPRTALNKTLQPTAASPTTGVPGQHPPPGFQLISGPHTAPVNGRTYAAGRPPRQLVTVTSRPRMYRPRQIRRNWHTELPDLSDPAKPHAPSPGGAERTPLCFKVQG